MNLVIFQNVYSSTKLKKKACETKNDCWEIYLHIDETIPNYIAMASATVMTNA